MYCYLLDWKSWPADVRLRTTSLRHDLTGRRRRCRVCQRSSARRTTSAPCRLSVRHDTMTSLTKSREILRLQLVLGRHTTHLNTDDVNGRLSRPVVPVGAAALSPAADQLVSC